MALHPRRPDQARLEALLRRCQSDSLTYEPVGVSLDGDVQTSLERARWETVLDGADSFSRGCAALREWSVHRGSGLSVVADGALTAGTNVAMAAPLPIGFVECACRVVAVVDEPGVFGFAYGTLSVHPERGEEAFILRRAPDGSARFAIDAVAMPAHPLARLAPGLARVLQNQAGKRYLAAMQRATGGG